MVKVDLIDLYGAGIHRLRGCRRGVRASRQSIEVTKVLPLVRCRALLLFSSFEALIPSGVDLEQRNEVVSPL